MNFLRINFYILRLWVVNVIYFTPKIMNGEASAGARKCKVSIRQSCHIRLTFLVGYFRSLTGAVIAFTALFVWLLYFQLTWRSWPNAPSIMIYVPDEDRTGW